VAPVMTRSGVKRVTK